MAKKKTIEPNEEQVQAVDVSMEETTPVDAMPGEDSTPLYGEDMTGDWGSMEPPMGDQFDAGSTSEFIDGGSPLPAGFSADGEAPFDTAPSEAGPIEDGISEYRSEMEAGTDEQDYGALLQEVDSATPIETEPGDDPLSISEESIGGDEEAVPPPPSEAEQAPSTRGRSRSAPAPTQRSSSQVLTIDARDHIQTDQEREEIIWHEIRNAYRTRRILTGTLGGLERTPSGKTLAVVDYKGFRVAILLQEMLFLPKRMPTNADYLAFMERQRRNLNNMLGAEIDFIVRGIDSNTRSIVASRKDAMLKKRQTFYMNTDELGGHMIYEGRVVQARVIAVAEKVIRVEVFGVECPIIARDLSWEWLGDAREHFCVGDRVLVRVLTIDRSSAEDLSITASIRSVSSTTNVDNVKKCQRQCRYVGRVTDVRSGVVYIRLNNGVNAIAHACYDMRTPGKKDDVSFAVTQLDEEKGIAIGIITRIIKQNL